MKTAKDILTEHRIFWNTSEIEKCMKSFAEEALREAAERAKRQIDNSIDYWIESESKDDLTVILISVEESILSIIKELN